jgi:multidrug efflux pump subunit AcrA (membrane-fusion protein)
MRSKLFTIPALLLFISVLTACGKGDGKTPLPRLVKVIVLGQSLDANQSGLANKDPGSLNFDASGKVTEVLAKRGDRVQAGQSLARLMPNSISSDSAVLISYKAAKAELQSAEADFKRYSDLRTKNFISASEFDRRVAVIEGARAKYEQAMEQMGFVTLRAIESGLLTEFNLTQGQLVGVKDVVAKMKVNDKSAKVVTKNKQSMVLPVTAIHSDGVSVYKLILDQDSKLIGTIAVAKVELGKVDDVSAEVLGGLNAGDMVIATGWHALSVGQKVRIAISEKAE